MKKILLVGGSEGLLSDIMEYGDRLGDCIVEHYKPNQMLLSNDYSIILLDALSDEVNPIEIIKRISILEVVPRLGLLVGKDGAGTRIQDALFQYARAKGMRQTVKLSSPLYFGDVQSLCQRQHDADRAIRLSQFPKIDQEMLQHAIKACELTPFFQPKIALKAGHIIGAEALVRWRHPEHGLIPPDAFIPLIEEYGLMTDMTWLMLEQSLRQAAEWRRLGYNFKVAVNFSASTFSLPGISKQVLAILEDVKLDPDSLTIELTESAMVENLDTLLETVLELFRFGIEISIDDYGTGYSSLQQVSVIPASEIKVDQSFVRDMLENSVDHLIVRNTVRMAHSLGMRALAEGVESKRQAMALARNGCDEAQGFFFSKPIEAGAFLSYASDHTSSKITRYFNLNRS